MARTLLETKMFLPRSPQGMVPRARLAERLRAGTESALLLVSAPAGFGKTTLLTEWLGSGPAPGERLTAWLSLDAGDNVATAFWTYVTTALHRICADVGGTALELLSASQPPPVETVLATLINDISRLDHDVVLVLDDYHVIEAGEVHEGVAHLLDHHPPQLHVVIAARADPPLPLARLRARGQLVEVRAADLRFTAAETATYLNDVMGLGIEVQDVTVLEERTEGWIAALKLAALSIHGRSDTSAFIAGFAGDDRYVVDYLVEEVLQRQPERDRDFLLRTAVLDRLCGPLCDAVTGQDGGRATLERLDRGNLFLIPLDDRRQWYRYHHLFADVLRRRLVDEQPLLVPELHHRASRWYAEHGERSAAIGHALAGGDPHTAADLIEASVTDMMSRRQERTLKQWLQALPAEVVRARPVVHMALVRALMSLGEAGEVPDRLDDIERQLAHTRPEIVVDEQEYQRLPASIELYRAALALTRQDVPRLLVHAQRATDLAPPDADVIRGGAAALVGLTSWAAGNLEDAHRAYIECMNRLQKAGFIADVLGCAITVADIRVTQGRLEEAMTTYRNALDLVAAQGESSVRGSADMHVGISQILRERGDLTGARRHLTRSQELGEPLGMPQNPWRWHLAMARLRQAEGDLAGAVTLLDEAERLYVPDFLPQVRPVAAWRARVWAAQGRVSEALGWASRRGLSVHDELSYMGEFEHVTLARVLLARHRAGRDTESLRDATQLLKRLRVAADDGGRTGTVIEVLVLLALAHHAAGDRTAALTGLDQAAALAAPEGYVAVFTDGGASMASLLHAAHSDGAAPARLRELLRGMDRATPAATDALTDPLTDRELAVLRMLGTELDGPQIARELVVSLNTVRTHTKNIYAKLGVSNRRAAVRRARELHLLRRGN